jgi:hypothetical protein
MGYRIEYLVSIYFKINTKNEIIEFPFCIYDINLCRLIYSKQILITKSNIKETNDEVSCFSNALLIFENFIEKELLKENKEKRIVVVSDGYWHVEKIFPRYQKNISIKYFSRYFLNKKLVILISEKYFTKCIGKN